MPTPKVIFSATADPVVDAEVFSAAKESGALVNVVDIKNQCDFYCGAQVRRGPVQILVGTQGTAPALAGWIRRFLEEHLPPDVGTLATLLGQERAKILTVHPDFRRRAALLRTFVDNTMSRLTPQPQEKNEKDGDSVSSKERIQKWLIKEVLSPNQ
ncbi:MAG: hypothetical protein GY822_08670 [Deltaproteobacteria bacterium]|nr:hypothetical protein [Deltaproteobacteria bacterium]